MNIYVYIIYMTIILYDHLQYTNFTSSSFIQLHSIQFIPFLNSHIPLTTTLHTLLCCIHSLIHSFIHTQLPLLLLLPVLCINLFLLPRLPSTQPLSHWPSSSTPFIFTFYFHIISHRLLSDLFPTCYHRTWRARAALTLTPTCQHSHLTRTYCQYRLDYHIQILVTPVQQGRLNVRSEYLQLFDRLSIVEDLVISSIVILNPRSFSFEPQTRGLRYLAGKRFAPDKSKQL